MSRRPLVFSIIFGVLFVAGITWFVVSSLTRTLQEPNPGPAALFDSDQDGLTDAQETEAGTNPNEADSDFDGLTDLQELTIYKTAPLNSDSDGDGFSDGVEVLGGYDPLGSN